MKTTIYVGTKDGRFDLWVEERIECRGKHPFIADAWWFPEIDYGHRGQPVARHPARVVELTQEMIGKTVVTMSEHIVLAFQKFLRDGVVDWRDLDIYVGNCHIKMDTDGDLEYWPGGFFDERLALLR
jgi:hypothetical protein